MITITVYIHGYVPRNHRLLIGNTVPLVDFYDVKRLFKEFVRDFLLAFKMPLKGKKENYIWPAELISQVFFYNVCISSLSLILASKLQN